MASAGGPVRNGLAAIDGTACRGCRIAAGRRVRRGGEIKWRGRLVFVSEVLAGEPVGLLEQAGGRWCIAYGPIELGIIDPKGRLHKPRLWI